MKEASGILREGWLTLPSLPLTQHRVPNFSQWTETWWSYLMVMTKTGAMIHPSNEVELIRPYWSNTQALVPRHRRAHVHVLHYLLIQPRKQGKQWDLWGRNVAAIAKDSKETTNLS